MRELYLAAGGGFSEEHRYGIVYYFARGYRPARDADADNVSKRVWDALEGVAYKDDQVVRLRLSGVIEAGAAEDEAPSLQELDLSDAAAGGAKELLRLVAAQEAHILYVEVGTVRPSMFAFNLAARGDR
jgi:Endodeoxyribonuclease RusA